MSYNDIKNLWEGNMTKCSNIYGDSNCIEIVNKVNHEGTEHKFEAIEKYAEKWVYKMIYWCKSQKIPLKGLVYVDPMASSGTYHNTTSNELV